MAKKRKRKAAAGDIATNRQAAFRYNLLEKLEAGIVLQGSEVKSLRNGSVQLKDAYAEVREGEVWLRNMHIAPYPPARENHDPERPRKLLLHKREIERLIGKTAETRADRRADPRSTSAARARRSSWRWRRARRCTTSATRSRTASRSARCSGRSRER